MQECGEQGEKQGEVEGREMSRLELQRKRATLEKRLPLRQCSENSWEFKMASASLGQGRLLLS